MPLYACTARLVGRRLHALFGHVRPRGGIDLTEYPIVAVGSVCRRQGTAKSTRSQHCSAATAESPCTSSAPRPPAWPAYGHKVLTADSLAWSFQARAQPPTARTPAQVLRQVSGLRALTPLAFFETIMVKSYETLVDSNTRVDVNTGIVAASRLQAVIGSRELQPRYR